MTNKIAEKLREYRKKMGLSVEDVSVFLNEQGYEIAARSVYGYENGSRMPNADVFLSLCMLYGCTDVLFEFGYSAKRMPISQNTADEQAVLDKYNELPDSGKDMIRGALGLEKLQMERKREIS